MRTDPKSQDYSEQRELLHYRSSLFQQISEAIISTDINFRIITWNRTAEKIYGWKKEEVIGRSVDDVLKTKLPHARREEWMKSLFENNSWKGFVIRSRKDGTQINLFTSTSLLRDDDGNPTGIVLIDYDVVENKQASNLLLIHRNLGVALSNEIELNKALHLSVDAAMRVSNMDCGGVYMLNKDSKGFDLFYYDGFSNDFIKSVSHYDADEEITRLIMEGKPIYKPYHDLGAKLEEAHEIEGLQAMAVIPIDHNGQVIACLVVASHSLINIPDFIRISLETVAAQIYGFIVRIRSEEVLLSKFDTVVETSPVGIVILDRNGRIKFTNEQAEQILNLEKDDIEKQSYSELSWKITDYDGNPFPEEELPFRVVSKTKKPVYNVRYAIEGADEEAVLLSVNAAPFFNVLREMDGMVAIIEDITEKVSVDSELKENKECFYQIIQQTPLPILVCNSEGIVDIANPAFLDMFGMASADLVVGKYNVLDNRNIRELELLDSVKRVYKGENVFVPEVIIPAEIASRHGSNKKENMIYELLMFPVMRQSEEVWQVVMIWNNITERKRMELSLRENEERWQFALEGSKIGVWDWNPKTGRFFCSRQWKETLGYGDDDKSDITRWDNTVHPEDSEMVRREMMRHLRGETPQYFSEHRRLCKDGTYKWVLDRGKVIEWDEDGKPLRVVGTQTDITDRKRIEDSLRESEEKYRLVVENSNEVIIVIQDGVFQDQVFKFINPRCSELLGYPRQELLHRSFLDFVYPDDKDLAVRNYQKGFNGEYLSKNYSLRVVDNNKNVRWIEIRSVPINWEGKPAILSFASDITERRKIEEELFKAQKLESVGKLAGGIAHDFNNILTGILGNISLAKMLIDPKDKAYSRLTEAEKASLRARDLTQQILTFSRGGALILETTSIANILKDSATFALRGSNVRCEFSIPDDLYNVHIDEGQISQVISNLVNNAVQAMSDGGTIEIDAENVEIGETSLIPLEPGKYVRIAITDHGVGIPEENLSNIFDPYFSTKQKGSGLGLAIAYSIVRKHGGHIDVESKLGVGTTFYIYLPAFPKRQILSKKSPQPDIPSKWKVLVMDDEEIIRDLIYQTFSSWGHKVSTASEGAEAIEMYRKAIESGQPFDVVIMDLTIPGGIGGKEAIARILEIDPDAKVIVSSGYFNDPVMADFRKYGFKGIIVKPYKVEELRETLNKVLVG